MRFSVLVFVCVLAACGGSGSDQVSDDAYRFVGTGSEVVISDSGDVVIGGTGNEITVLEFVEIDQFEVTGTNNTVVIEQGATVANLVMSGTGNEVCVVELSQIAAQNISGVGNQIDVCD